MYVTLPQGPADRPPLPPQAFIALAVIAAAGSFLYSMVAGAIASDVCRTGCDVGINVAIVGVMWGGIVLAAAVGLVGVRRARRRGRPTWPWPLTALLLIAVSAVAGLLIINAVTGMG